MKRLALPLVAVLNIVAGACAAASAVDTDRIKQSTVRAHMEFLASDAMNGRGSGTRDEWIAAKHIAAQMRREGLQLLSGSADFVQTMKVDKLEVVGAPTLKLGSAEFTHGDEMLITRLNAASISGGLKKFHAGAAYGPGVILLMPESQARAIPPEARNASLLLYHETAALRQQWSCLAQRTLLVGRASLGVAVFAATPEPPLMPSWPRRLRVRRWP